MDASGDGQPPRSAGKTRAKARWNSERRTPPPGAPPIRLATLLLPVANHLQWRSLDLLPQRALFFSASPFHLFCLIEPLAQCLCRFRSPLRRAMQQAHRCHEAFDLPKPGSLDYLQLIDRGGALLLPAPLDLDRQHSSSQLPIRTKRRSLDLLPQRALFDSSQLSSLQSPTALSSSAGGNSTCCRSAATKRLARAAWVRCSISSVNSAQIDYISGHQMTASREISAGKRP